MKPLDTASSAGLIAPDLQQAVPETDPDIGAAATAGPDPGTAIQDVPLAQVPEGEVPVESPELVLSQKVSDDARTTAGMPGGVPGLSGPGGSEAPQAQDILSGVAGDVSAQTDHLLGVVNHAAAPAVAAAQGLAGQALAATGAGAPPDGGTPAAGTPAAAAPELPGDPVGALLSGAALPALPGIDVLFQPIRDLLSSFGTGIIGALDPTAIMSQASQVIEVAMGVGKSSLAAMGQSWESEAAQTAQTVGEEANNSGLQTSQRGLDISGITQQAAAVVQQGNAQLTTIAASFASQATALAPVVMTPPAQTALITSATQHLGEAVTVANITRGDLAGKTAELSGVVQQLVGVNGPQAAEAAQNVAQSVGEPLLQQAQGLASDTSGLESMLGTSTGDPASTTAAGLGAGSPGLGAGSPGMPSGSPGVTTGGPGGTPGMPSSPPAPGAGVPGGAPIAAPGRPGGLPGMPGSTTPASSSFMGGGAPGAAGAGQRNNEEEHGRTVETYRSATGNDDLTGPLGESAPEVIGAVDSDEDAGYDSQF